MSKVGKALGITAVITGIAGIAAGTVAVIKKVKAKENIKVHKCKCEETEKNKDAGGKSFEERVNELHKHKDCDCNCGEDDCTCTVFCDECCNCDDSILEEEPTNTVDTDNAECLKGKEDCETCNFKDGCKLK